MFQILMRFPIKKTGIITLLLLSGAFFFLLSATSTQQTTTPLITKYYAAQLDSIKWHAAQLEKEAPHADAQRLIFLFEQARIHFKNAEALIEYHFPASATKLNGAPLLEAEPSEPNEPKHPEGFQVLEELVYGELNEDRRKDIAFEISSIITATSKLQTMTGSLQLNPGNVFDAIRLNLYRMTIKGITGFDNPVGFKGIAEAEATIRSTRLMLNCFARSEPVQLACDKAIGFIQQSGYDFNAFNRAVFIKDYINPLCIALYDFQEREQIPFVQQSTAFSVKARHLFAQGAFDVLHFAPNGTGALTDEQVTLGKKLFYDPAFSSTGNRSCGSCHLPNKAFTDGLKTNESILNGQKLARNTPTLINAALQPAQFYDSRIYFLEDQAHDVISNTAEMGGKVNNIATLLGKDKTYKKRFAAAYKDKKISAGNIKKALAAYVRSLVKMDSPFDLYMRGDSQAMNAEQVRGFNLFTGKAKCATCHFMPLFSGAVPPLYKKMESEVLGVPANNDTLHAVLDQDKGKYNLYNIPHQMYAFKTTTVRNTAATAPYMHNGVFSTLEEVLDFYEKGGGAGLGFDLPNQTLSADRLHLSAVEQKEVIAFLHALTDTSFVR